MPGPVLFISDLHLSPAMPRTTAAFERFLETVPDQAKSLVILGDFFEFWVGDDERHDPFAVRVMRALQGCAARDVSTFLMHGNRDFLIGNDFAAEAQLTLLHDPAVVQAAGHRLLLTHGDAMCTDDLPYMRFRRWTRKRWVQRMFLALPLSVRLAIARRLRNDSEAGRAHSAVSMLGDVTKDGIAQLFSYRPGHTLVHGHTHRPRHHLERDGERWVLSDWDFDGAMPRADALRLDATGLQRLPLAGLLATSR